MTQEQLISILEKVRRGIAVERSNLDLKHQWWNLNSPGGIDEFLKDITSMANGQSGDSTIILGVDEEGKLHDAPLPIDEADIQSKHKDKIDPRVKLLISETQVEGKIISTVTIPHSDHRPHVIGKYGDRHNWIPVRFGTSTLSASRSDLDEMYQERFKSQISDLHLRLYDDKIRWGNYSLYGGWSFLALLSLDNYEGGVPDYIIKIALQTTHGQYWKTKFFMFEGLMLNQEFKVAQHERKQGLQVYLSDRPPGQTEEYRDLPQFDSENLLLSVFTRSGKKIEIEVNPNSIEKKHEG